MPVFHEHKLIFYHIGKTGGMSVERSLGLPPGDYKIYRPEYVYGINHGVMTQHARPTYIQRCIDTKTYEDYYKFTIVRNPWDRLVSCYYYLYNIHKQRYGDFASWLSNFAYNHVMNKKYNEGDHLTPQHEYTHTNNEQTVNYIGRYETLQDCMNRLCDNVHIPRRELPTINRSGKRKGIKYRDCYTTDEIDMVYTMYTPEIELYGYEF